MTMPTVKMVFRFWYSCFKYIVRNVSTCLVSTFTVIIIVECLSGEIWKTERVIILAQLFTLGLSLCFLIHKVGKIPNH